jgi:hypothetical protein
MERSHDTKGSPNPGDDEIIGEARTSTEAVAMYDAYYGFPGGGLEAVKERGGWAPEFLDIHGNPL